MHATLELELTTKTSQYNQACSRESAGSRVDSVARRPGHLNCAVFKLWRVFITQN